MSTETSLIDVDKKYQLVARLKDYSSIVLPREGTIQFKNPCDDPFTFNPSTEPVLNNILKDKYTGAILTYTLKEFTITPARCKLTYSVTAISEEGQVTSSVPLSDISSDLEFDG